MAVGEDTVAGPSFAEPDAGLLSAALASIGNAVAITDIGGVIRWVNAAFTKMSGYPASEAVGSSPRLLKSGVQDEAFYTQLWSTILAGRPWQGEVVNRHRSGRLYTVVQTITPIVDPAGAVTHFVAVHEDVTALREGQARLRALFDRALDAVVFFDDLGWVLDANPVACELAGRGLDELVATPVSQLLAGDWGELWPRLRDGRRRSETCRVRRSGGGGTLDVAVQVVPEVMPGVHVAICRDVTAQRQVEAERDFQAQLVEAVGVAVIATDLEGKVTFWNTAAEKLYGWARREVLGHDIIELNVTPDATEQAEQIMATARSGDTWSGEFEVRRRDGTTFPALVTNSPYLDASGQLAGIIGVSTDITELRQVQRNAQLRASQQAAVARLGQIALSDLDLDALFDEAVEVVAAELDVPMASLLELTAEGDRLLLRAAAGTHRDQVGVTTIPNDRRSQAGYTLERDEPVTVDELASETRFDIPWQWTDHGVVSGVSTPLRGPDGNYGVLAAHTTTRRGFSGDEVVFLDAVAAVLGAAIVRDRIETELQATVNQLARSDEIRTAFLRATSHELRTPLTALAGFAATLEDHDTELDPEQRRRLTGRLRANTDRLSRLITDLLDVDRLSSGLMTANRQPHDLAPLVHRVAEQQDLAGRRLHLDLEPVRAEIDPAKLERVVANLIANAVRHTPTGATIHIGLHRKTATTVLMVADDGPGIDPNYLDDIFEPFVQGPEQHHTPQPGTGLGLSLVRELITLHGGTVTACNRPDGGAQFEITLPDPATTPTG